MFVKNTTKIKISASQRISIKNWINYDHNKNFGLFKFQSGYRKIYLNSPKGYSQKIINAQTCSHTWDWADHWTRAWSRSRCWAWSCTARCRSADHTPATDHQPGTCCCRYSGSTHAHISAPVPAPWGHRGCPGSAMCWVPMGQRSRFGWRGRSWPSPLTLHTWFPCSSCESTETETHISHWLS